MSKKTNTQSFDFNVQYNQEKDKCNTSINVDSVLEKKLKLQQYYTGLYYEKCYHNAGRYKWINADHHQEYVYEGKLYANDLHGYGRLIYPDNSVYEGLFFHNKRFGPGVITYPDGLQDVGLWDGNYLVRLSQNTCLTDTYLDRIPNIAKSVEGKLFLLQYRKIIPIVDENDPVANLVKKLNMNAENSQLLYSRCVRNYKSIFMNRSVFDRNFYTDPKELIVDVVDHFDENNEPVINKINAINLLAWNNEEICIEIMKHSFLNRKYEKIISYKIRNAFLPNKRHTFMNEGPIEEMCLKLLIACRNDDIVNISQLICDYDLYPNVSDCYGNTTIIYAALTNQNNAIKTLVNLGANVNAQNDECLTPLMLCILHYLAIKEDVLDFDWETAFFKLPNDSSFSINGRIWPTGSNSSISSSFEDELQLNGKDSRISSSRSVYSSLSTRKQINTLKNKSLKNCMVNKHYVFNIIYKDPQPELISKRATTLRKTMRLSKKNRKSSMSGKMETLNNVMKTIQTLIQCGADVNVCEIPFPPLISSLFTDNLEMVETILETNCDVNKRTRPEGGSLNPLHIVCAMDSSENQVMVADMLIRYGVEVGARSDITHWPVARDQILAGDMLNIDDSDLGKTPLHILAMRYDFEVQRNENCIVDLAKIIVENGGDANEQYLGHNVLSLATLRGNTSLMEYVLSNGLTDPNGGLGYNMGVPLTLFNLKKHSKLLMPVKKLESILNTLVEYYANPFNNVPNFDGNALEFAISNRSKKSSKAKENVTLNLLFKISATVLRRYIDSRALQLIYDYLTQNTKNSPVIAKVIKYLDFVKAHRILQILLDNKIILSNFELCISLLNFIYMRSVKSVLQANLIDKRKFTSTASVNPINKSVGKSKSIQCDRTKSVITIKNDDKVYALDFDREDLNDETENPYKENMPEIDENRAKYKVCYGCLEKNNKILQLCPYCTLVYFCSENCNINSNKSGEHPCNKIFYLNKGTGVPKRKGRLTRLSDGWGDFAVDINDGDDGKDGNDDANDADDDDDDDDDDDVDDKTDDANYEDDESDSDSDSYDDSDSQSSTTPKRRRKLKKKRKPKKKTRKIKKKQYDTPKSNTIIIKRGKKICTTTCKGKLIAIAFKEPLKEVERKMRHKLKRPETKYSRRVVWSHKLNRKLPVNEENINMMLRVAKRINLELVPVLDFDRPFNPCDPFDYKFWHLFLPYCVFQNGDLFYRANDCELLYKLHYKHI